MSVYPSLGTNSSLLMSAIPASPSSDLPNDSSNQLYEDRDHFQAIFTNDSRFFDTSLHLFKSYRSLGYITTDDDKDLSRPTIKTTANGHRHNWTRRLLGLNHNHEPASGLIRSFLTPTLIRRTDHSNRAQLDSSDVPNEPVNNHRHSSMVVQYQRKPNSSMENSSDDHFDDSDIIITRL